METVYSPQVVEFVTVATEFCAFLEQSEGRERKAFVERLLRLLPLLYVKALLLPAVDGEAYYSPESYVTEQDYNWLRAVIQDVMGEADAYEEAAYDLASQSDEVALYSVGEKLADIYQAVRNFVECFRNGVRDNIEEALWAVNDNFELYWGRDLVDVLRRLHLVRYDIDRSPAPDFTDIL